MQARLHLIKGNPQGKQVEIPTGTLTVGRAEDSDLIIASTRVSRHHCEIVNEQNRLIIRDKGSGNGTLVNGAKIQEQPLAPGDEVQVGPLTFVVEINGVRQRSSKPAAPARPAAAPKAARPAPKPAPRPAPAAKPKAPAPPAKKKPGNDILASLERLAGTKKPTTGAKPPSAKPKGGDDVLEISDEDLIDTE